jgi:hypothetical protein
VPAEDLRSQSIERVLSEVQGLSAVGTDLQVRSIMALIARCAVEVGDRLAQLSMELDRSRAEMARASETSSRHTAALVQWTKVLAVMTGLYTLLTLGLLVASILR